MHPRGFQHLSRARGPQSTRARGGDGKGVTCQALVPVGDFDFFRFFEFGQFFSKLPRATRDASEKGGKKAGSDPSRFTERACALSEMMTCHALVQSWFYV